MQRQMRESDEIEVISDQYTSSFYCHFSVFNVIALRSEKMVPPTQAGPPRRTRHHDPQMNRPPERGLKVRRYSHLFRRAARIKQLGYGWSTDHIIETLARNTRDPERAVWDLVLNDESLEGMKAPDERKRLEDMTFGIECEFALIWRKYAAHSDEWGDEWYQRWLVLLKEDKHDQENWFNAKNFQHDNTYHLRRLFKHRMMDAVRAQGMATVEEVDTAYAAWTDEGWPGRDWTLTDDPLKCWSFQDEHLQIYEDEVPGGAGTNGVDWFANEVTSPKMRNTERSYREVRRFFRILRHPPRPRHENWPKPFVGRACGLHVHVSHPCFSHDDVKKLMMLFAAFETEIMQIHPTHRTFNYAHAQNVSTRTLYSPYDWGRTVNAHRKAWPLQQITKMLETDDIVRLKRAFIYNHITRHGSVNVNNIPGLDGFTGESNPPSNTIEFRQHEGTTNGTEIVHWVKFLTRLVLYACNAKIGHVVRLILRHLPTPTSNRQEGRVLTIFDLMEELGLPEESTSYFRKRIARLDAIERKEAEHPDMREGRRQPGRDYATTTSDTATSQTSHQTRFDRLPIPATSSEEQSEEESTEEGQGEGQGDGEEDE